MTATKISLARLFGLALAGVAIVVMICMLDFLRTAHQSATRAAQTGREAVAQRVHEAVVFELGRATRALEHIDHGVKTGAISVDDDRALEADLFLEVLADEHLAEVSFTRAKLEGYTPGGEAQIAAGERRQTSVERATDGQVITHKTWRAGETGRFEASERRRPAGGAFDAGTVVAVQGAQDPTSHATFSVLAEKRNRGRAIWSDLHWAEHDLALGAGQRRVVLTVQKEIEDAAGHFVGVARIGLLTNELDAVAHSVKTGADDPHVVALFAVPTEGETASLVARVDPSDRIAPVGDDLRIISERPPAPIAALLASPLIRGLDPEHPKGDGSVMVGDERYLVTIREISAAPGGTTGWFAAVLGPEAYYTRDVRMLARSCAIGTMLALAMVIAIGIVTIRAVRRGLERAVGSLARMRAFDFAPAPAGSNSSVIREIDDVVSGLERAKTVVRAMGKYVPVELVRRLYSSNQEPALGGKLLRVSLMFTDIEGFTTLAEKLPPDTLAQRLGDYLAAMTRAIEAEQGTIDKYIGDAVMAIWNAPTPVENHARRACAAVLAAMKETEVLFASKQWEGLPPLVTRFGVHQADVMVGNFGAPTRLSYTALGDGVNLAARLEPLCKQYGVRVLVSEDIVRDAKHEFVFRRVDRVAVKGKTKGIDVFELLGRVGEEIGALDVAKKYEQALEAYLARDFTGAGTILEALAENDEPSSVLLARCKELAARPPGEGWSGVYVASSK